MKAGFIGIGHMGVGMAANILKAGHDLTVYNRTPDKAQPLVEHGAHPAAKIADACHGDAVITMLSDDNAVESVVFSDDGIIDSLSKGAVHISMSTISVALSDKLTQAHENAGQRLISAPVLGRPEAAAAGKLFIVAAGRFDAIDNCRPLFDAMGQQTFTLSEAPSSANLVKLSVNFLITSVIEALGESIALTGKAGIDPHQFIDIITSSLFAAPVYKTYGELIADKNFDPAGFAAKLGHKDIRLALAAAETLQVPMPLACLINNRFLTLFAHGGESLDWSAIGELPEKDAGE